MSSLTSQPNHLFPPKPNTHSYASTSATSRHSPSSSSSTAAAPSSTAACAACKYQRRKCTTDCTLAPYFPAEQQRQFLNAHRLFGVSNILKILKSVEPHRRSEAMRSIIFQSNVRAHDPVGGCYRIILDLQHQVESVYSELQHVTGQISFYRAKLESAAAAASNIIQPNIPPELHSNLLLSPASAVPTDTADYVAGYDNLSAIQQQQLCYNYFFYDPPQGSGQESVNGNAAQNEHTGLGFDINIAGNVANDGLELELPPQMLTLQQKPEVDDDDDVKPLVDMFDVRQAYPIGEQDVDSVELAAASTVTAVHCSSKDELKEDQKPVENVQEHDLKSAASLFTLTNCITSAV